jgi:transposase InsO family protein
VNEVFTFIAAEKASGSVLSITLMCVLLKVSRSGFYAWETAVPSARARRRAKLVEHVRAAFEAGRGTYGVRRVHAILGRSDDPEVATVCLGLVRDLMAELGLHACQPRAYRVTTVPGEPSGDQLQRVADHVGRDFTADAPGCRLVGDITYIRTWTGWLYLATVIDCHSRAVVGWAMAEHMRAALVCDALSMAATNVALAPGAVFHSDRGSQYTSSEFARHLTSLNVTPSMGRTGVCWDNALAESFFGAMKNELVYRTSFPTQAKARTKIAEYIEVFYNRQRIHSALGYKTPAEITAAWHATQATAA